jgi:hypothetical protein
VPTRLLRDGILESEAVCSLQWAAEVLYRRLMSVADDYGRFSASPKLIRAKCYPLQIDKVSDSDVGKWLAQVAEAGLVRVYPAEDGKRYLEIVKFGQQVRAKSKHPAPADVDDERLLANASGCKQVPANAHLDVSVGGDVFVDDSVAKATGGKPPAVEEKAEEPTDPRRELYEAGKSLLHTQGMPKAQTGSFITKLAKDYGQDAALEAVRSAVSNRPLEAAAYLKATCQRLKGERKDAITVTSTAADATAAYLAAQAQRASAGPSKAVLEALKAVRVVA